MMWRQRLEATAARAAHKVQTVNLHRPAAFGLFVVGDREMQHAAAERKRAFYAVGEPRAAVFADGDAIDDHLDVVLAPAIDGGRRIQFKRLAVDADANVAFG